jgi:hypothetical protein
MSNSKNSVFWRFADPADADLAADQGGDVLGVELVTLGKHFDHGGERARKLHGRDRADINSQIPIVAVVGHAEIGDDDQRRFVFKRH